MKIELISRENIFQQDYIEFKSKNFIFGRNGSGKSTLCNLIKMQKHLYQTEMNSKHELVEVKENGEYVLSNNQEEKFDVRIFQGFESVIGENNNLNAIALSAGNKNIADNLKILNKDLEKLNDEKKIEDNIYFEAQKKHSIQESKIDKWFSDAAKSIKQNTQYQIDPNYNKRKFKDDLHKSKRIENLEELNNIIKETTKNPVANYIFSLPNLEEILDGVNDILVKTVEIPQKCNELNTPEKEGFARRGLSLHEENDNCLFCGSKLTIERLNELNQHFNEEYKKLEDEVLSIKIEKIKLQKIEQQDFYTKFNIEEINTMILEKEKEINNFIENMLNAINEKKKNITKIFNFLELEIPQITELQIKIDELIRENNIFGDNLYKNISVAKENIKCHLISIECEKFNFNVEKNELDNLKRQIPDITKISKKIEQKNKEIQELKNQQKDTSKIAQLINERLEKAGKNDLQLKKIEADGFERYEIQDGENEVRSVAKISTGEKNIIAFLYFIYSLEDIENQKNKPKIIIFDDPMNSNDDTMQYLIITELQKLYSGTDKNKFNHEKDYFLCLTHNVYFYLNVQPHGSHKDGKGKTKYDKSNFFRIENKKFKLIKNEKEDFKTNYAGLWVELNELCERDFRYAILNSMRRIIETFVKFNNLKTDVFYRDNPIYKKLFDVGSHSIDDLTHEQFTETPAELKKFFSNIFVENGFEYHFKNYWK
ncbi:AAA family ATPase [Listeria marthii]|uniref:AAA family ATPase n=1 Tax=Listeria marthii TaxID=529731 RepID=UPI00162A128F|nr:AAA family ATPase [Listeria marthii]MBC2039855.1 AAA family ATPase [Listeria marthii]MBF2348025.1 AAA family ATPase [Listeria marthii]